MKIEILNTPQAIQLMNDASIPDYTIEEIAGKTLSNVSYYLPGYYKPGDSFYQSVEIKWVHRNSRTRRWVIPCGAYKILCLSDSEFDESDPFDQISYNLS